MDNDLTAKSDDELKALLETALLRENNDKNHLDMLITYLKQANEQLRLSGQDRLAIQMELNRREPGHKQLPAGYVGPRNTIIARRAEIDAWSDHPWYPVLRKLNEDLTALMPDYSLDQVKAKFGDLRFYATYPASSTGAERGDPDELIRIAEKDIRLLNFQRTP
jgi:hypothetical protein